MGAGAPKGNKNAEKWDKESAYAFLDQANALIESTEIYLVNGRKVEGYSFHYLGEVASRMKTYTKVFQYLAENYELQEEYNILKTKLEANCFSDTKKGIINTATGIINLKSNYGWTDRVDQTTKGEKTAPVIVNLGEGEKDG